MDTVYVHQPVLLEEAVQGLRVHPSGIYVDGTYGRGGHAEAIAANLNEYGRLYVFDKDPEAIKAARERFAGDARVIIEQGSFTRLQAVARSLHIEGKIGGLLLDLGMSSPQLDDARRGFSFSHDGPLDMRMDTTRGASAAQWIASADEAAIAAVLKTFGEERYARRIARAIVSARRGESICTTLQLARIVSAAHPAWERDRHPATRVFQALRIYINDELGELEAMLKQVIPVLAPGGRLAVISFHSLEDRLVKRFIRSAARSSGPADLPVPISPPTLKPIGKAVYPGSAELARNPRARSARLRIAERLP